VSRVDVPFGNPLQPPTFAEVAKLIVPHNCPPWLPALLEWWAQGIRHDILVDQYRLTTSQTVEELSRVMEASAVLERSLSNPNIWNLLEIARFPNQIQLSVATLRDLNYRAETTLSSSVLVGKDGKTKRGHGKPSVPNVFEAKTLVAARILELGRFLNKFEPGITSKNAAAAAQSYWLASGGTSKSFGNPLNGWKHHFRIAKDEAESIGLKRLIWWKDLIQCAKRGRPPWYLGTCFPVPEAEIRSSSGV
jgi:hypothetical protein